MAPHSPTHTATAAPAARPSGGVGYAPRDRSQPDHHNGEPGGPNGDLPNFRRVLADAHAAGMELLRDVELAVKIELGRTQMLVEDVLRLSEGSVVELDRLAGEPVDLYVNERLVARGEVLVLNDNFCVRISEILADAGTGGEKGRASPLRTR